MKLAAARAIADFVTDSELAPGYIIPSAMNFKVPPKVAAAVAKAAVEEGVARIKVSPAEVEAQTLEYLYEGHLRYLKDEAHPRE
jgi:malate dehydrogenase (oxaloacetate-decarboxylating)